MEKETPLLTVIARMRSALEPSSNCKFMSLMTWLKESSVMTTRIVMKIIMMRLKMLNNKTSTSQEKVIE